MNLLGAHQKMLSPSPPPNWNKNEISKFIESARANEFWTFVNCKNEVERMSVIDHAFRKAVDGVNHSDDWFAGLFLLRAHSNYLGSCRLCWSAQIPECYALLRSCLENALYGLYLAKHPALSETWLRRSDNAESRQKVRNTFSANKLLQFASKLDEREGVIARAFYEITIDSGAHPNELGLMSTLQIIRSDANTKIENRFFSPNSPSQTCAFKETAQVGVCALSLFSLVYPERFAIQGVTDLLRDLKRHL